MITHIFDKQEFHLDHKLNSHFEAILSFKKRAVFESSKLFQEIKHQIYHITNGVEWKITQKNTKIPDKIRIAAWNVERGKNLEGMIMNAIHHILGRRPVSRGNLVLEWNNREKEKVRSKSGIVRDEVER